MNNGGFDSRIYLQSKSIKMPDSDNSSVIKAKMQRFGAFPDTTPDPSGPMCVEQCVPCCSEDEQTKEKKAGTKNNPVAGGQQSVSGAD